LNKKKYNLYYIDKIIILFIDVLAKNLGSGLVDSVSNLRLYVFNILLGGVGGSDPYIHEKFRVLWVVAGQRIPNILQVCLLLKPHLGPVSPSPLSQ